MTVKTFTRTTMQQVRSELESTLDDLGKKLGIAFSFHDISFTENTAKTSLNMVTAGDNSVSQKDQAKAIFDAHAKRFGLKPDDFGKQITYAGKMWTIRGINPNARKNGILVSTGSSTEPTHALPHEYVARVLKREEQSA